MTAATKPQIVHESETQRQHVRLTMLAKAQIDNNTYTIRDLSSGGAGIRDISGNFSKGRIIPITLTLPFGSFSIDVSLKGEVQHYNSTEKFLGCRFINLDAEQISLLNYVLKAHMAADSVGSTDLLNVIARNNFTKIRLQPVGQDAQGLQLKKQLPGLMAAILVGLVAAFLILSNLYESLFIVRSIQGTVSGPIVEVRASSDGVFTSQLTPDVISIKPNDPMGSIASANNYGASTIITSPCDCFIRKTHLNTGEFVTPGMPVASLIPVDSRLWITAAVESDKIGRISLNDRADLTIVGSAVRYSGRVASIESGMSAGAGVASPVFIPLPSVVKINVDQKIPVDLMGRPATAVFAAQ